MRKLTDEEMERLARLRERADALFTSAQVEKKPCEAAKMAKEATRLEIEISTILDGS